MVKKANKQDNDIFSSSTLFLAVPVIVVITLNIFFLIQVIRILKAKLETEPSLAGSSLPITLKSAKADFWST